MHWYLIRKVGFELLDDQRKKIIERIKNLLIEKIQHADKQAILLPSDIEPHFTPLSIIFWQK